MSSRTPTRETEARLRYGVVIEKASENYSAYVPDLPGCVATGDSVEETTARIREAIVFHLEGMREDRVAVPATRTSVAWVEVDGGVSASARRSTHEGMRTVGAEDE